MAVLNPQGDPLWASSRWRETEASDPRSVYSQGVRRGLVQRANAGHEALRFREWRAERSWVTTLAPLANNRVLAVSTPAACWVPPRQDVAAQEVDPQLEQASPAAALSRRERQVATLLVEGKTIRAVAETLNLSVKTIEGHRDSIYRKLSVRNRAGLAAAMARAGVVATVTSRRAAAPSSLSSAAADQPSP
ncbi:MAG: DNA-binding response regulator [Planctomycetota bacterium]|nr:MAG: DNA-binding response regulator [Planctomycetota bacterium]